MKPKKRRRVKRTGPQLRQLFGSRKRRPCTYCGRTLTVETATVDHVIAFSKGGYERRSNLTIACRECNSRKGSMSREDFLKLMGES
jgi:5-methylcytosine-specific restriction endonuclease McrA